MYVYLQYVIYIYKALQIQIVKIKFLALNVSEKFFNRAVTINVVL